jgi:hypothetical protein
MIPRIIESYSPCGVNVGRIVKRIIRYIEPEILDGLDAINLVDIHTSCRGFARYRKDCAQIDIYVNEILGWQPWLLRKSFLFPYLSIGLCLGHEIDHHVHRDIDSVDESERLANTNAFRYIYPSIGIFKPVFKATVFMLRIITWPRRMRHRNTEWHVEKRSGGPGDKLPGLKDKRQSGSK